MEPQADRLAPILALIEELADADLARLRDAVNGRDDAHPIDYSKRIALKTPLEWQAGVPVRAIGLERRPCARDAMAAAKWAKQGLDPVTILFKLFAACSDVPFSALETLDAEDYGDVAAQCMEWFAPFAL